MSIFIGITIFFVLGTFVGSFLNVVIYRTYYNKPFLSGRSYCPKCKKTINWYDNIPILSFLILKGKCRNCGKKISIQYPLIELTTGILFAAIFYVALFPLWQGDPPAGGKGDFLIILLRDLFIVSVLLIIFVQDFKWYIVLDKVVLPATAVIFLLNLLAKGATFLNTGNLLLAMLIGAGFFYLQFIVSGGRWIGGGDIRIGAFMGASLGYPLILVALFLAYLIGSIIAIFLLLIGKKKMSSKLPLGTFLTPAAFVVLLWGNDILSWYLDLFI